MTNALERALQVMQRFNQRARARFASDTKQLINALCKLCKGLIDTLERAVQVMQRLINTLERAVQVMQRLINARERALHSMHICLINALARPACHANDRQHVLQVMQQIDQHAGQRFPRDAPDGPARLASDARN